MFSSKTITKYTNNFSDKLSELEYRLDFADTVIIGAGAGLSSAAGFTYSGDRFEKHFADFKEKYGFVDMYSGGFCTFDSTEEFWAYWSRYIFINRYMDDTNPLYAKLLKLVENKEYFVLTTNVDHQFQKAGYDKKQIFYTQGDYGLFQCSEPCCQETYDNESIIRRMLFEQENMRIPTALVPYCPKCGKPMTMNLRTDERFVQDKGWYRASKRYSDFISSHENSNVLFLELGVGYNTPTIIKFPFWKMTAKNANAFYVCINHGEAYAPDQIKNRALCINADISELIKSVIVSDAVLYKK